MSESSLSVARSDDAWRLLRYLYRVPLLLLLIVFGLPPVLLCIALASPKPPRPGREPLSWRMIRWWQGSLMRVFGFRLRRFGTPHAGATLFVANHVSWIDICTLHSQRMMGFVAKAEIAHWPVVGWLAAQGQTIFHRRGDPRSLDGVMQEMERRLAAGRSVGVFPEGRTRDGREVGLFHARIFQPAVVTDSPVQPVALRYGEHGSAQTTVAFAPGESFFGNFLRLLGDRARPAEVHFLEPIGAHDVEGRRRIAEICRARIVAAMES